MSNDRPQMIDPCHTAAGTALRRSRPASGPLSWLGRRRTRAASDDAAKQHDLDRLYEKAGLVTDRAFVDGVFFGRNRAAWTVRVQRGDPGG